MRLSLYIDIYPGMDMKFAAAYANPSKKMDGCKRYKLNFLLPDPNEPDAELEAQSVEEVDDES